MERDLMLVEHKLELISLSPRIQCGLSDPAWRFAFSYFCPVFHLCLEGSLWYQEQQRNVGALFDSSKCCELSVTACSLLEWHDGISEVRIRDLVLFRAPLRLTVNLPSCASYLCVSQYT